MTAAPNFGDRLADAVATTGSHLVAGLDPDLAGLPADLLDGADDLAGAARAVEAFCGAVIEGVAGIVPAIKPQSAFFEALGAAGVAALEATIARGRDAGLLVIEDAKRGDIGSTMAAYAAATLGTVQVGGREVAIHDSDALTVSPYLGPESLAPAIAAARGRGKGLFVLVRTSNPGSGEIQEAGADGATVAARVAAMVDRLGADGIGVSGYSDVGAVAGLTYPQEAPRLRAAMPAAWLLVPGLGAQGGRPEDFAAFLNPDGLGAVANASRSVAGAWRTEAAAGSALAAVRDGAGRAARATSDALRAAIGA